MKGAGGGTPKIFLGHSKQGGPLRHVGGEKGKTGLQEGGGRKSGGYLSFPVIGVKVRGFIQRKRKSEQGGEVATRGGAN